NSAAAASPAGSPPASAPRSSRASVERRILKQAEAIFLLRPDRGGDPAVEPLVPLAPAGDERLCPRPVARFLDGEHLFQQVPHRVVIFGIVDAELAAARVERQHAMLQEPVP